jgi:FAD-dependent urate hydroxylase
MDVAVIGAGPYGLSCTSFLRAAGLGTAVFGETMSFWRERMPAGMLLRSERVASHIASPDESLSLDAFEAATDTKIPNPIPIEDFIRYGEWFGENVAPDVDGRRITEIELAGDGFELRLDDGGSVTVANVVVAAGLEPFAWRPPLFDGLPPELASHSADHSDFSGFRDADVLVVGSGQSALESGALLKDAGARVEVVARAEGVVWLRADGDEVGAMDRFWLRMLPPTGVGGRGTGWAAAMPDVYRRMPERWRIFTTRRCLQPAGSGWIPPRLGDSPINLGRQIVAARPENGRVHVELDDGSTRAADHILMGTGWRVDVAEYPFLGEELLGRLERLEGHPLLHKGMESSVPGLHFVGAPAALSFGPIMRFVVGSWYAGPVVARSVAGRRQRPVRFAYRPRRGQLAVA